jgi:hypothetical protein
MLSTKSACGRQRLRDHGKAPRLSGPIVWGRYAEEGLDNELEKEEEEEKEEESLEERVELGTHRWTVEEERDGGGETVIGGRRKIIEEIQHIQMNEKVAPSNYELAYFQVDNSYYWLTCLFVNS